MRYFPMFAATLAVLLAPAPAQADDRDEALAAIKACQEISVDTVRLACFDKATISLDTTTTVAQQPSLTDQTAQPLTSSSLEAERIALRKEREELAKARANLEKNAQRATEERLDIQPFTLRTARGEAIEVSIERITYNRTTRLHTFYTSDGDIVRQYNARDSFRPPSKLPASATVKRSRVGSRWISFAEYPDRSLKVQVPKR